MSTTSTALLHGAVSRREAAPWAPARAAGGPRVRIRLMGCRGIGVGVGAGVGVGIAFRIAGCLMLLAADAAMPKTSVSAAGSAWVLSAATSAEPAAAPVLLAAGGSAAAQNLPIPPGSVVTPSIQQDALAPIDDAPARPTPAATPTKGAPGVSQMLAEGEACFSRKQYQCSIRNASSVLQLQPGNGAAATLKSRAEAAQADALNNIKIE